MPQNHMSKYVQKLHESIWLDAMAKKVEKYVMIIHEIAT